MKNIASKTIWGYNTIYICIYIYTHTYFIYTHTYIYILDIMSYVREFFSPSKSQKIWPFSSQDIVNDTCRLLNEGDKHEAVEQFTTWEETAMGIEWSKTL